MIEQIVSDPCILLHDYAFAVEPTDIVGSTDQQNYSTGDGMPKITHSTILT